MNSDLPIPTVRFGVSPALRWWLFTPFTLFFAMGVSLMFDRAEKGMPEAGLFISGLMGLFLLVLWWVFSLTSLTLSSQGMRIRFIGVNLETPWENVELLYRDNGQFGLLTRTPMEGKGVNRFARNRDIGEPGAAPYDNNARQWLAELRYVPLRGFDYAAKSGKLQAEMRRYLPGLPGLTLQPPQPKQKSTPAQKRAMVLFAVIVIAALGLGYFLAESKHGGQARGIIYGLGCVLGGLRVGISSISCWRNHKVLSIVYFILAVMLLLLSLPFFIPDDAGSKKSATRPVPAPTAPLLHPQ